jgi:hypothetical protein
MIKKSLILMGTIGIFFSTPCHADWNVTCGEFHNHCHKWYNEAILRNAGENISHEDYQQECESFFSEHDDCVSKCGQALHVNCEQKWHQLWCESVNNQKGQNYAFCRNLCTLMSASGNGECGKYWDPT